MSVATIESYTDKARAYVNQQSRRGRITPEHAERYVSYAVLKDTFATTNKVRKYRFSVHNVGRLLRSAGATRVQADPIFREPNSGWGPRNRLWSDTLFNRKFWDAFDHPEVWGRDGVPCMLVGHPYPDPDRHQQVYDAIAALGLEVRLDGESYYGHGTSRLKVVTRLLGANKLMPSR